MRVEAPFPVLAPAAAPRGVTLADVAERRLREDITTNALAPSARLRLEELRDRYEVGASPLREALSRLVGEGLVEVEGNKGFRVAPLSFADLDDIAWMRATIEGAAVREAIARGDAAWEAGILAALHRLLRATGSTLADRAPLEVWNREHDGFHRALVGACGSPRAMEMGARLEAEHRRYRVALIGDGLPGELIVAEHRALADAALARDADETAALLARHMRITSDFYANQLRQAAAE
ncbi:FCD domain-containing protein [Roseomonas sp. CCTCC AB2023176]|uniref:FCD domain-containing protein n=1 Tax=Roseomonas sp. CCTCC AB2023176 TaxID=3342640 RepID=UPI0035D5D1C8